VVDIVLVRQYGEDVIKLVAIFVIRSVTMQDSNNNEIQDDTYE
jgi:hypothetical protein